MPHDGRGRQPHAPAQPQSCLSVTVELLHRPTAVLVPGYLELISYEFDGLNSIMALVFA
jgi:hypothetical protein